MAPIEAFSPKASATGLQRGITTRAALAALNIADVESGQTYFDENGVQLFFNPAATQGEISPAGKASPTDPGFFVSQRAEQQVEFADLSIVGHTDATQATASGLPQITTVAGGTYQSQDAIVIDADVTIDGRALTVGTYYFPAATTASDVNDLVRLSAGGTSGLHKGIETRANLALINIADLQPGEMYVDENGILLVFDPNATSGVVAPQGKALPTDPGYFKAVSTATSDAASDWVASYSYTGTDNEVFSAVAVAGAIDINGQALTTGTRYLLKYPTDQVSGLTLGVAEFAKMELVGADTVEQWIDTTDGMTLEIGKQYIAGAHTLNFPVMSAAINGFDIKMVPSNGDWNDLADGGLMFNTTDTATIADGQTGVLAGSDQIVWVARLGASNWLLAVGSGSAIELDQTYATVAELPIASSVPVGRRANVVGEVAPNTALNGIYVSIGTPGAMAATSWIKS